jgi:hypothetical protein
LVDPDGNDDERIAALRNEQCIWSSNWENIADYLLEPIDDEEVDGESLIRGLCHGIAKLYGFSLQATTFYQMTFMSGREEFAHLYFRDARDIRALGRLTGNPDLIQDFEDINSLGRRLQPLLSAIGRSVNRIARGEHDPYSDLDRTIIRHMKRCRIV